MGGRAVLAFRVLGLLALGAWLFAADRFLVRSGLPEERRLAGLLLVFTGGGIGGLLWSVAWIRGDRAFDLFTGAFPFVAALANPHFVAGSALLLGALTAFAAGRSRWGAALGALLAFVRPYDGALLVAIEGASALFLARGRDRLRRLLPLAAALPGLAYTWWVFTASPSFRAWVSPHYADVTPTALELAFSLGPATLLALTSLVAWRRGGVETGHLTRLVLWAVIALLVVTVRPVSYSLQFIVGVGLPLLALAAIGLARVARHALAIAVPLMATSAVVVVWLCTLPGPRTHPPLQSWLVAQVLRQECHPGDLVLAPAQIGSYVGGLTPCWPFVSHPAAPDYDARLRDVARFYDPSSTPAERAALLATIGPAYVVLPPALPPDSFGASSPYVLAHVVRGPTGALEIWSRDPARPGSRAESP